MTGEKQFSSQVESAHKKHELMAERCDL